MSEKIEINTLITKHENKCKDCRFEMIDIEDPLWEYGSPLKRVLIDNHTGETYDSVSKLVGLLNKLDDERMMYKTTTDKRIVELEEENEKLIQKKCLPCELVNLQTREIDKLKDENEQLKKEINMLKITIGRNESYIERLTHQSNWHC